jgi:hypothetical protein
LPDGFANAEAAKRQLLRRSGFSRGAGMPYGHKMFTTHALRAAILFTAAGLLSRFTFRTFETRWQIVIFWGAVAVYQLALRPLFGKQISPLSTGLDLVCVTIAIIAMKIMIEGQL